MLGFYWICVVFVIGSFILSSILVDLDPGVPIGISKRDDIMSIGLLFSIFSLVGFAVFLLIQMYDGPITLVEPDTVVKLESGHVNVIFNNTKHEVSDHGRYVLCDESDIVIWKKVSYTWWDNPWSTYYEIGLRTDYTNAVDTSEN